MQLERRSGAHRSRQVPRQAPPRGPTTPRQAGSPPSQQRQRPPMAVPGLSRPKRLHPQVPALPCPIPCFSIGLVYMTALKCNVQALPGIGRQGASTHWRLCLPCS